MFPPPLRSTLFPYTTLFRSIEMARHVKGPSNHLRHPLRRPQFCTVAIDDGALQNCGRRSRSEEHTSELQSLTNLVCRLLLEKKQTHAFARLHRGDERRDVVG